MGASWDRVLLVLANLDGVPGGSGRSLFTFKPALQIHLCQGIIGIEFEKLREENLRLPEIAFAEFPEAGFVGLESLEKLPVAGILLLRNQGKDLDRPGFPFHLDKRNAAEMKFIADQFARALADQDIDRISPRQRFQPGGEIDRVANHRRVRFFLRTDVSSKDIAVIDPEADRKWWKLVRFPFLVEPMQ